MDKKIIDSWARIIEESSSSMEDNWDDDYDTARNSREDMAEEHFQNASEAMKDVFSAGLRSSDIITFTMMLIFFKKWGLKDALEYLNGDATMGNDVKKKFSDLLKAMDYYISRSDGVKLKDFAKNEVYESEISDDEVQEIVMGFDLRGWEQDGEGPVFINVGGDGERKEFRDWSEAGRFLDELSEKD